MKNILDKDAKVKLRSLVIAQQILKNLENVQSNQFLDDGDHTITFFQNRKKKLEIFFQYLVLLPLQICHDFSKQFPIVLTKNKDDVLYIVCKQFKAFLDVFGLHVDINHLGEHHLAEAIDVLWPQKELMRPKVDEKISDDQIGLSFLIRVIKLCNEIIDIFVWKVQVKSSHFVGYSIQNPKRHSNQDFVALWMHKVEQGIYSSIVGQILSDLAVIDCQEKDPQSLEAQLWELLFLEIEYHFEKQTRRDHSCDKNVVIPEQVIDSNESLMLFDGAGVHQLLAQKSEIFLFEDALVIP